MSELIHFPSPSFSTKKSATGCIYRVQTSSNSFALPPSPQACTSCRLTARAVKNLITKKFWHSVSLVLVAIYRPEFRLSLPLFGSSIPSRFPLLSSSHLAPFLSLSLSLSLSPLFSLSLFLFLSRARAGEPRYGRARVSVVYSSPLRTTHHRRSLSFPGPPGRPRWPPTLFIKRRYIIFY